MITKITCRYSFEVLDFHSNDFGFTFNIGVSYLGIYKTSMGITLKDNRYEVKLPFKGHPLIEDNYRLSLNRLKTLTRKLKKTPTVLKDYHDVIRYQLEMRIIEEAAEPAVTGEVTYLPHRAVIKEDRQTTKLRIVFAASAKNAGPSLNDCLYKGPCLVPLLYDILVRFRINNVAIVADIKQAFLQVIVAEEDRDYLRFLWWKNPFDENPEIIKYRFNRVIFGATCSQFLLNGVVKVLVEKYNEVDPEFVDKILHSFYVDDLNTGVKTTEEGVMLYKKLKYRFEEAHLKLRKWRTNDPCLREIISEKNNEMVKCDEKVLGIRWDENEDNLLIDVKDFVNDSNGDVTKREVLSIIASFYDPVGYIQPIVVQMKIFSQDICREGYCWDDKLNVEMKLNWDSIIANIRKVDEIHIQRCYAINEVDDPFIVQLIGFSDASQLDYGCCIYFKFIYSSGKVKVSFVTSKSRIVPIKKQISIPRLGLLGNVLLCRLVKSVLGAVKMELEIKNVFCFTDSQVSLAWIRNEDKEMKQFVQNRVIEIRRNVPAINWYYCKTSDNPADLITRINFKGIRDNLWWYGPTVLMNIHDDVALRSYYQIDKDKEIE